MIKVKGTITESTGAEAERMVLDLIKNMFKDQDGKVFVNEHIPGKASTPDFVIPVIGGTKLKILLIECKASRVAYIDGSTNHSDPYEQVKRYEDAIISRFGKLNKEVSLESYVILPQGRSIPTYLTTKGRSSIKWGTLNDLHLWLKPHKLISHKHSLHELVDIVYDENRFLKNRRIQHMDKKQMEMAEIDFGGTWKFTGLAGSGKTLILAHKMVNDALGLEPRRLLYLTQNKNLLLHFTELIHKRLLDDKIGYKDNIIYSNDNLYVKTVELENGSTLNFANYDAFPTNFFTSHLDKVIFSADSYGPLYKVHTSSNDFKEARTSYLGVLKNHDAVIPMKYPMFDGLYIDEFQDCLIDSSRALLPLMFTKKNEKGYYNLVFTEDMLQTYIKYSVLKELDDTYQDVKKKDISSYSDLGVHLHNHTKKLSRIYRTPKNVFTASISILEKTNGLRKNSREEIDKFDYFHQHGKIEVIGYEEFPFVLNDKVVDYSAGEIYLISEEQTHKDVLRMTSDHEVYKASSKDLVKDDVINLLHENNSRGLEAEVVFLFVQDYLLDNPNYLYTLMCRTHRELIIVKMPGMDQQKFDELLGMIKQTSKTA